MQQHDMVRCCQNRGLVLPRLGGADEAFCVLAGMKAEMYDDRVAHMQLGSIFCALFPSDISGCSGRVRTELHWCFGRRSPCWNGSPFSPDPGKPRASANGP